MMKYDPVEFKVITFDAKDVIVTSCPYDTGSTEQGDINLPDVG